MMSGSDLLYDMDNENRWYFSTDNEDGFSEMFTFESECTKYAN